MNVFIHLTVSIFLSGISLSRTSRDRNNLPYRVVCYYSSLAALREHGGLISPENLDASLCTHMIYAVAVLENNEIRPDERRDLAFELELYQRFNSHCRTQNPNITTLIAVGGWDNEMLQQNTNFSKMAKDPATRLIFVKSVIEFLKKFDFDGLSLDWTYPVFKGKWFSIEDKNNFVELLEDLRKELSIHGFVLSIAAATGKNSDRWAYHIFRIARTVDFVNLLTFDFHGPWETFTGANSPLYAKDNETVEEKHLTIDSVVRHWIRQGMYPHKINLGIPAYSRCYLLKDVNYVGYGAPTKGFAGAGPITRQPGFLAYREVMPRWNDIFSKRIVWDDDYKVYYSIFGDQWCTIEERSSIVSKVHFMRGIDLRNVMIWSYDLDLIRANESGHAEEPLLQMYHYYKGMPTEQLFNIKEGV